MKIVERVHPAYIEYKETKKRHGIDIPILFGKYQYIYETKKGKISLVQLKNYFKQGEDFWEIYCWETNLFEDVERFDTKKEAIEKIKKYLI